MCTKIGNRQHKRRNNTQDNRKTQNKQNRKQKYRTQSERKKNITQHKSSTGMGIFYIKMDNSNLELMR